MDKSKIRELVNGQIDWMRWALQLQDIRFNLAFERIEPKRTAHGDRDAPARTAHHPEYLSVDLEFDPEQHCCEHQVMKNLRHEMLHAFHLELELLYEAMQRVAPDDQLEILDVLYHNACERMVGRIERMLDLGLGLPIDEMLAQAKRVDKQMREKREATDNSPIAENGDQLCAKTDAPL